VGVRDEFGTSGPLDELLAHYGLTAEAVCEAAMAVLKLRRKHQ
jgi:transketolase C-terminal domain/subunit